MNQELSQMIHQILDPKTTDQHRKHCEQQLKTGLNNNPTGFLNLMIHNCQNSDDEAVRSFCVIQIRKNLSNYSENNYTNYWNKLDQPAQQSIKNTLFKCLVSEHKNNIRYQIADCISEIGSSLIEEPDGKQQWDEIVANAFKLIQTGQDSNIENGLAILSGMLEYNIDEFMVYRNQLLEVCKMGLEHHFKLVNLAAVDCFCSFVESAGLKDSKPFEKLFLNVLNTIWVLMLEKDEAVGQSALQILTDLADSQAKFFKPFFKETFGLMYKIVFEKKIQEEGIKKVATEMLIIIAECVPKLFKDNQQQLQQLLEMIFMHMINIGLEIQQEWCSPPEGFDEDQEQEDDEDLVKIRFGMNSIYRLISTVGQKTLLPVLSGIIEQSLNRPDWRYPNAGIMSLSQIGEYMDNCRSIEPIINGIIKQSEHSSPKVRYALCHCIGQLADDMKPEFQQKFHGQVIPILQKLLDDDVPRVASHSCSALSNFVAGMELETFQNYMQIIFPKLCSKLVNSPQNISVIKESSIAAIASCAGVAGKQFTQYYEEVSQFLFGMLETHQAKEYRDLRGQLIECLAIIATAVDWDVFKNDSDQLINFMINVQEGNLEESDPQKKSLLSGWQKLATVMKKEFAAYLPRIVPSLFKLIQNVIEEEKVWQQKIVQNYEEDKKDDESMHYNQEADLAINMLTVMMEELGELFADYVEKTTQIVLPFVNYSSNEDMRKSAAKCLPALVSCAKTKSIEGSQTITKEFLKILTNAVESEYFSDVIIDQILSMKECIEICGKFLKQDEITEFSEKVFKFLLQSDKRKVQDKKGKADEDMEENEVDLLEKGLEVEEDLQIAIAELLGIIFKTHQELSVGLANHIYQNILPKALDPSKDPSMHNFGISLVDDMVEYLGYQHMSDKWLNLLEALIKYSTSRDCSVRQAATYGIGVFAEKSVGFINDDNEDCLNKCLKALKKTATIPQGQEKRKIYGFAKDNVTAAIGKIIKHHSDRIDSSSALCLWISQMPIKYDDNEGYVQHEMLADLVLINPSSIIGDDGQNMPRVIRLFGQILESKINNEQINAKIKQCMQSLKTYPQFANSIQQISSKLTEGQKTKLEATVQ